MVYCRTDQYTSPWGSSSTTNCYTPPVNPCRSYYSRPTYNTNCFSRSFFPSTYSSSYYSRPSYFTPSYSYYRSPYSSPASTIFSGIALGVLAIASLCSPSNYDYDCCSYNHY